MTLENILLYFLIGFAGMGVITAALVVVALTVTELIEGESE